MIYRVCERGKENQRYSSTTSTSSLIYPSKIYVQLTGVSVKEKQDKSCQSVTVNSIQIHL